MKLGVYISDKAMAGLQTHMQYFNLVSAVDVFFFFLGGGGELNR